VEIDQREELLAGLLTHLAGHLEVLAILEVLEVREVLARGPPATSKTHSCSNSGRRLWLIGCLLGTSLYHLRLLWQ
jgi:hypothetical protein